MKAMQDKLDENEREIENIRKALASEQNKVSIYEGTKLVRMNFPRIRAGSQRI